MKRVFFSALIVLLFLSSCQIQWDFNPNELSDPLSHNATTSTNDLMTPSSTADLNMIGSPSTPIAYEGFKPQGFLTYNPDDFYVNSQTFHGREFIIAWEKSIDISETVRSGINQKFHESFLAWWEIFEGFPYETVTIVLHTDPNFPNPGEHGIGFETPAQELIDWYEIQDTDSFNHIDETISHWVFHLWNNEALRLKTNEDVWFREGVTTYYGNRYAGESAYLAWMNENYSFYRNEIFSTACDVSLIEMGKNQEVETPCRYYYYLYKKGALVSYLIDMRLIEKDMNLDVLLKYLYDHFEYGTQDFNSQDVLEALNQLTGDDWTPFFNSYIFGVDELPLSGEFELIHH